MKVEKKLTVRIRRPVHIVLALVPSSDKDKKDYKICLDRHNLVFCTCKGWRYNGHTCRHLTEFRAALMTASEQLLFTQNVISINSRRRK